MTRFMEADKICFSCCFRIQRDPIIHITHEDFPTPGDWTILPLLSPLVSRYKGSDVRWVLFLETHTAIKCDILFDALAAADKQKVSTSTKSHENGRFINLIN